MYVERRICNLKNLYSKYRFEIQRNSAEISADNNIYANDKRAELHSAQDEGNKSV